MTCKTHPRYQAVRKPFVRCEDCWRMWLDKQDQSRRENVDQAVLLDTQAVRVLRRQLSDAGDRHDWDECGRLEAEIRRLSRRRMDMARAAFIGV